MGNVTTKPQVIVGRNQTQKNSFVSQAVGAREALLAILPLTKAKRLREAIFEIGHSTDVTIRANGGYTFSTFEEAAIAVQTDNVLKPCPHCGHATLHHCEVRDCNCDRTCVEGFPNA